MEMTGIIMHDNFHMFTFHSSYYKKMYVNIRFAEFPVDVDSYGNLHFRPLETCRSSQKNSPGFHLAMGEVGNGGGGLCSGGEVGCQIL